MTLVVNHLTLLFKLIDGGQAIVSRGEDVPEKADKDQLDRYVAIGAVVDEDVYAAQLAAAASAKPSVSPDYVAEAEEKAAAAIGDADVLRGSVADKDAEIERLKAQIALSKLSGNDLAEWFKGKKLDELETAGLSDEQALELHTIEDAKGARKREPVLDYLDSLVKGDASGEPPAGE